MVKFLKNKDHFQQISIAVMEKKRAAQTCSKTTRRVLNQRNTPQDLILMVKKKKMKILTVMMTTKGLVIWLAMAEKWAKIKVGEKAMRIVGTLRGSQHQQI